MPRRPGDLRGEDAATEKMLKALDTKPGVRARKARAKSAYLDKIESRLSPEARLEKQIDRIAKQEGVHARRPQEAHKV